MHPKVLAGVDGSRQSLLALDWAADEAVCRGLPLLIVTVVPRPYAFGGGGGGDGRRGAAEAILAAAGRQARRRHPDLPVALRLLQGQPGPELATAATEAQLLVVGSRGLGGIGALLLGSVSLYLAVHARCPLVVLRDPPKEDRRPKQPPEIVAGIGTDRPEDEVLGFAFDQASRRHLPLRIVHGAADSTPDDAGTLAETLAKWQDKYPDVHVIPDVRPQPAHHALTRSSPAAELLVVGTARPGGFASIARGSTTYRVLHHALCPIAVVPSSDAA